MTTVIRIAIIAAVMMTSAAVMTIVTLTSAGIMTVTTIAMLTATISAIAMTWAAFQGALIRAPAATFVWRATRCELPARKITAAGEIHPSRMSEAAGDRSSMTMAGCAACKTADFSHDECPPWVGLAIKPTFRRSGEGGLLALRSCQILAILSISAILVSITQLPNYPITKFAQDLPCFPLPQSPAKPEPIRCRQHGTSQCHRRVQRQAH
jgi:hypothetical protein